MALPARLGAAVLLCAAVPAAWAQQVEPAVSAAARCIVSTPGAPEAPEYPFELFKSGKRGAVQALLIFDAPDQPPRVQVQERTDEAFEQAVLAQARHLRVPCLRPEDGTVRLLRDYVFRPDDERAHWFSAVDAQANGDVRLMRCRSHVRGEPTPDYPAVDRRRGIQGRVVAQLRFESADRPPVLKLHARPSAVSLQDSVEQWVQGLRLPCHAGQPVSVTMTFVFVLEGEGGFGFRELPLRALLAATDGIQRQRLDFDTRTMDCPFDLKWHYRQPHLRNLVGEIGSRNAARRQLLEWMETIELKLPPRALDSVYGDHARITIPCVHIDLTPKE